MNNAINISQEVNEILSECLCCAEYDEKIYYFDAIERIEDLLCDLDVTHQVTLCTEDFLKMRDGIASICWYDGSIDSVFFSYCDKTMDEDF